jgi:serine/threonine protein kinase
VEGEVLAGRYRLATLIGVGGMARVYRAHDELLDRDVAVKVFQTPVDEAGAARVTAEVRALGRLSHPHLVALYDGGTGPVDGALDRTFLVMELVEGHTLADRIRSGPMTSEAVRALGADLADALAHVHARGIVHRDVKPANVLLGCSGSAHLADFGIARSVEEAGMTRTGVALGTAPYLSPEQVRGESAGPASDIYALGLVLLEALTSRREYAGHGVEAALARLTRPPRLDDVDAQWAPLLRVMTSDQPQDRPTAGAVAARLGAAGPGTGWRPWSDLRPDADTADLQVPLLARRRTARRLVPVLAVLCLAAAGGIVALVPDGGRPGPRGSLLEPVRGVASQPDDGVLTSVSTPTGPLTGPSTADPLPTGSPSGVVPPAVVDDGPAVQVRTVDAALPASDHGAVAITSVPATRTASTAAPTAPTTAPASEPAAQPGTSGPPPVTSTAPDAPRHGKPSAPPGKPKK